ncbi:Serine/threonine phosphatase stp [Aquisphaera giovannonii]|uniref:Serine/threonine phosphatase stp n=1 Tax=Aquisphaera giovannonii TaxID=406548 RepID=A0A5B9W053_9BACT|nr:protein phosphatase 2C domain-containing protein [Aquisphaera giovannonii]QEH34002.1 Serine/threonine phosphatase stp [Aquisphaera giovannonii]
MCLLAKIRSWWHRLVGQSPVDNDQDATDEFATLSSLNLLPGQLKLKVGVVSVRGNYREHNEDNFFVPGRRPVRADLSDASNDRPTMTFDVSNLFIVADGMGGQQAGEKASLMAVEQIPPAIARRLSQVDREPKAIQESIREAVAEVNSEILSSSGLVTEYSNMGTTVVLALFRHDKVYVAGIGDSRAYRLREGRLEQLTEDHNLARALLKAGTITAAELPNHKFTNVLYLYLGSKDARGGPEEFKVLDVKPGDRFLLASDGLTSVVPDEEITRMLGTVGDPQQAAVMLKDLALHNDSHDNVTCLVIHVVAENAPAPHDAPSSVPASV